MLRYWLKQHLPRVALPDLRFHDLRNSCASLLIAQGVHSRVGMEILGHTQISMTMNTYSHVVPDATRRAVDLLGGLLAAP